MFKKAIPFVFASGLVLAGCGNGDNNNTVPDKDETPMENLENRDWTPDMNGGGQSGSNMDGIDTNNNGNTNGGIINDTNRNGMDGNGTNGTDTDLNGGMNGDNIGPNQNTIIDDNTSSPSQNNGNNNRNGKNKDMNR